jgi:hypothetical protein
MFALKYQMAIRHLIGTISKYTFIKLYFKDFEDAKLLETMIIIVLEYLKEFYQNVQL